MPQELHNEVLHSKQLSHLRDQCQLRETIIDHRDRVFPPRTRRDSESLHRLIAANILRYMSERLQLQRNVRLLQHKKKTLASLVIFWSTAHFKNQEENIRLSTRPYNLPQNLRARHCTSLNS